MEPKGTLKEIKLTESFRIGYTVFTFDQNIKVKCVLLMKEGQKMFAVYTSSKKMGNPNGQMWDSKKKRLVIGKLAMVIGNNS